MSATPNLQDLQFAFDVGHSSIGWAVLQTQARENKLRLLGTGVVIFGSDDCLASKRRDYRRQRRHVRSTRQRVARMEKLLAHIDVLSAADLQAKHRQAGGDPAPWLLAARVLAPKDGEASALLTWVQLWDVLRWYAHNRGYDGNRRWSNDAADADSKEDTEKESNAISLMQQYGTQTMAETIVRVLELDPQGAKKSSRIRFKAKNAAFPRKTVEYEVRRILEAHSGKLPKLDDVFIRLLMTDRLTKDDRGQLAAAGIVLPARYEGGLLFGQLVPRFDNRIISKCPISGEKVPSRNCPEFFRFRWAMQLANIRVAAVGENALRPLSPPERLVLDEVMRKAGRLTKKELKDAVRSLPGIQRDNLDMLLMHPDADDALELDPVTKLTRTGRLEKLWPTMSPRVQKRARDSWQRGKLLSIADLRALVEKVGDPVAPFDEALASILDASNTRKRKKDLVLTRETLLVEKTSVKKISGRAAFARSLLVRASEEVMQGRHPKEEGGCLYLGEEARRAQLNRSIEEQINNHLVRHRLLILERLLRDLIADPQFANGDRSRVARLTIEVNRDLREMSGKTAKQIEQELGLRLSNHDKVSKRLEAAFDGQTFEGKPVEITAGLIRKARIADDLDWQCPYTGQIFEPIDLVTRRVDKDHIIPRSQRPSDSLDSLVVTYSEINKWKGARTAWQFIEEEQGNPVPGMPQLSIRPLNKYKEWVENLEAYKGHTDDKRRKKNRKALLLLSRYEEKEKTFLPGDLTATSQLVRLGAQLLAKSFADLPKSPPVVSIPGSVTGEVRKSWSLLGCLELAAPDIRDKDGALKIKKDIRNITHLHHALDACALAYASVLLPRDGGLWELMLKRNPNESDRARLRATGCFDFDAQGRFGLRELRKEYREEIRQRLAEKRVVQHVPADMGGMHVEENTRGVVRVEDGRVHLRQRTRDIKTGAISVKETTEPVAKTVGLAPTKGEGKLRPQKGVRVITDNFGVAILDHAPEGEDKCIVIPWHKVWHRMDELAKRNDHERPRLLRIGMLIRVPKGKYEGVWMVRGVKNDAKIGQCLDMSFPDRINYAASGRNDCKRNVSLKTLLRDGIEILNTGLVGQSIAVATHSE
ncbi:hypothetical protein M2103_000739 [Ereboglobus sp. PH5-5]|uniref:type II CRISPR RNA-guided endonuclease Cas9 n=1 Tax=Ereboglobus sp. PH5-5 TaxID=2940529 RepID=UPI002406FF8B|nr:type II CRISPR RNA-guided endonuclease Cas9 [Ereboglobus sp. PH5-5]MDF9832529.1 hypothetical protein [Ereboglobus sp. PH5-5]